MIDEAHLTKMIYDLQTDRGNVVGLPITLEEQLNKLCQVKHFRFGIFNNTDFALEWCERPSTARGS